jgi:hypothetical protein
MIKRFFIFLLFISVRGYAQETGDTLYAKCPIMISDTSGYNTYFTAQQSAVVKLEKIKGNIVITVQQKEQFLTMFFRVKKLSPRQYTIVVGADDKEELDAKYSFRSGGRASFINVSSGTVDVSYDAITRLWHLKINGLLKNIVERSVSLYKVKGEIALR